MLPFLNGPLQGFVVIRAPNGALDLVGTSRCQRGSSPKKAARYPKDSCGGSECVGLELGDKAVVASIAVGSETESPGRSRCL